jgi:hypothetical protein
VSNLDVLVVDDALAVVKWPFQGRFGDVVDDCPALDR